MTHQSFSGLPSSTRKEMLGHRPSPGGQGFHSESTPAGAVHNNLLFLIPRAFPAILRLSKILQMVSFLRNIHAVMGFIGAGSLVSQCFLSIGRKEIRNWLLLQSPNITLFIIGPVRPKKSRYSILHYVSSKGWKRFSSLSRTKAIADHSHRQPVKRIPSVLGPFTFVLFVLTPEVPQPGFLHHLNFKHWFFFFFAPQIQSYLKRLGLQRLSLWAWELWAQGKGRDPVAHYGFIKKHLYSSCFLSLSDF